MPKVKSLIICATPLQVMIAERIVALHPEEEFHALIYFEGKMSDKYQYYSNRLSQKCSSISYVRDVFLTPIGSLARVFYIMYYRLLLWVKYCRVSNVYLSSFECTPMRLLISGLRLDVSIHTFDDGLMNLLPSVYALNKSDGRVSRVYDFLLVDKPSEIRSRIKGHYTIYDAPNAAHIAPKKVDLFDLSKGSGLIPSNPELVSVFLGQPLFEVEGNGTTKNKQAAETLVQALGCSLYLPHPRESYRVDGVEYIETPLIAEDYLLQELEKHPERSYTVYSYFSTTLMNLKDHPRIKMVACRPGSLPERWHGFYPLLERMGIEIREFPNI